MKNATKATLLGGLTAGVLDITYACIHYGSVYNVSPVRICQSVAAGILGRDVARAGGWESAVLGLGLHFLMTTMMAGAFVLVAARVPALIQRALITGPLYGVLLYFVMNYVVVPLSNAPHNGHPTGQFLIGALFSHIVLVGLPIALIAKRFANR